MSEFFNRALSPAAPGAGIEQKSTPSFTLWTHLLLVMPHMVASLATFSSSSRIPPGLDNGHPL